MHAYDYSGVLTVVSQNKALFAYSTQLTNLPIHHICHISVNKA